MIDIRKNITDGKYNNNLTAPVRPKKPTQPPIFNMRIGEMTQAQIIEFNIQKSAFDQQNKAYDIAMRAYESLARDYNAETSRLELIFKTDCETATFGVATGTLVEKKKKAVWNKAWEHGHAEGFSNIWYWYDEFAEVTKIM